jgi:hypothetical protein
MVLGEIPRCPSTEGANGPLVIGVRAQHEHANRRMILPDSLEGIHERRARHRDVEQHHVHDARGEPRDGLLPIGRLGGDADSGVLLRNAAQAGPDDRVIVGNEHANQVTVELRGTRSSTITSVVLNGRATASLAGYIRSSVERSVTAPG